LKKVTLRRLCFINLVGNLYIVPNLNEITQEAIKNTNELLTVIPVTTPDIHVYSRVLLLKIDTKIRSVVFNMTLSKNEETQKFTGKIFITELDGDFLYGYRVDKGKIVSKLMKSKNTKKNTTLKNSHLIVSEAPEASDCPFSDPSWCQLDEVVLTTGSGSGSSNNNIDVSNVYDYSGGYETGGTGGSSGFYNDTNYSWDYNYGSIEQCSGSKYYNTTTQKCECIDGNKVEDSNGNCVKKPCKGDPVKNIEIAPQYGDSGAKGALYGCTRYGGSCSGTDGRSKPHAGIDIKSGYGDPIYAMYSGFIFSTKYDFDGAGYYTRIQSTVNGETFLVEYYHMQQENRILQGNPLVYVSAGDIIGYQGVSGNLEGAIASGGVDSHIHIEVRVHNGSNQWTYSNFNLAEPRDYLNTTIDDSGITQTNTNCN